MKKILFVLVAVLVSFTAMKAVINIRSAEIAKIQGVFVFTGSMPKDEYSTVGTVKIGTLEYVPNRKYTTFRDLLIKKLKQTYPDADGLIMADDIESAEVIKFKE